MSREGHTPGPEKITVTCKTCGVSGSFYSSTGVKQFILSHVGHEVVQGRSPSSGQARDAGAAPGKDSPERGEAARLPKVMVELVTFPALSQPVFRIRGMREGSEEAFVLVLPFEQGTRVREILARGQHVDQGFGGQAYTWDPGAIEFTQAARETLRLPAFVAESRLSPSEGLPSVDPSTLRRTEEALFGTSQRPQAEPEDDKVFPTSYAAAAALGEEMNGSSQQPGLGPWGEDEEPSPTSTRQESEPEPEARAVPSPKPEEKARPEAPGQEASRPQAAEEDNLLVSKSWYIQEGKMNKTEAARISKLLSAFRWKIEPTYTIGVILDDILSIETSKNEISGTLMKRIEGAGYTLSAVTSDQGKLVAWFKRTPTFDIPPLPDSAEALKLRTKVAGLSKTIEEERKKADEQRRLWEERMSRLLELLKEAGTNDVKSVGAEDPAE